jgi:rSAM/selenodomain-associated transferase 2/rSAM/selenodomain-associated transferase 1
MNQTSSMSEDKRDISGKLIIFTRYPVPGKTKTRLIPDLGPAGAAYVHRKLAENIIKEAKAVRERGDIDLEICYTGGDIRQMQTWLGKSLSFREQEEGDLGLRMFMAIKRALNEGNSKVVLIGTDIPGPVSEKIEKAFCALDEKEIVIGPAADGGYWLVGMKNHCNIFEGITWGKESVLSQTLEAAEVKDFSVDLLAPVNDIDTADDLFDEYPDGDWKNPYLSVIIPVLNEEARIEKVIDGVMDMDAEIIVVDGGSTDGTVDLAEKLGVVVVKSERGRSIQMNSGAFASKGNNFLFLHADTIVPGNFVSLIFEALMDNGSAAGAFRFKTDMDNLIMRFIEFAANLRSRFLKMPYGDQGIFISRADFTRAGAFPEVPVAEDIFLIRNLKKFAKIKTVPESSVTSARRWEKHGFIKTTIVNAAIFFGCYMGVRPERLYAIYKRAWAR